MTEKLFTGTLNKNQNKKQKKQVSFMIKYLNMLLLLLIILIIKENFSTLDKLALSYDVTSECVIKPCTKFGNPLVDNICKSTQIRTKTCLTTSHLLLDNHIYLLLITNKITV